MSDWKPFPLLHLPRLALEEVFSIMRPFELIHFSMASSKAKIVAKCFMISKQHIKYQLEVNTSGKPKVSVFGTDTFFEFILTSELSKHKKEENVIVQDSFKFDIVWYYSQNLIIDWMQLFMTVVELLNFSRSVIVFCPSSFPEQNKSIIDFIKPQMPTTNACLIFGDAETDEDVEYFLENINVNENLRINSRLSSQFQLKMVNPLENLFIDSGSWLSYNEFINLKGYRMEIRNPSLSNVELNTFLRSWMTSNVHQNLESLKIHLCDLESIDLIFDLPCEAIDVETTREGITARNEKVRLRGGIDIKRIDGVTGTLSFEWDYHQVMLKMIVSHSFV